MNFKENSSRQGSLNFNVHRITLRILLKCRFQLVKSELRPESDIYNKRSSHADVAGVRDRKAPHYPQILPYYPGYNETYCNINQLTKKLFVGTDSKFFNTQKYTLISRQKKAKT